MMWPWRVLPLHGLLGVVKQGHYLCSLGGMCASCYMRTAPCKPLVPWQVVYVWWNTLGSGFLSTKQYELYMVFHSLKIVAPFVVVDMITDHAEMVCIDGSMCYRLVHVARHIVGALAHSSACVVSQRKGPSSA